MRNHSIDGQNMLMYPQQFIYEYQSIAYDITHVMHYTAILDKLIYSTATPQQFNMKPNPKKKENSKHAILLSGI